MGDHRSSDHDGEVNPIGIQRRASQVKAAYVRARRRLYPEYSINNSARWKTVWERAAQHCVNYRLTPDQLVEAAFELFYPYPQPNQLLSDMTLKRARSPHQIKSRQHFYALKYECEMDEFQTALKQCGDVQEVLLQPNSQLSALFTYVVAHMHGLTNVCDQFRAAATQEQTTLPNEYVRLFPPQVLPVAETFA